MNIPYLFAGKDEIDVPLALFKLKTIIGCETLLLEGGSILNGAFQRADMIDELSLVVAPLTADANSKPLFMNGTSQAFEPLDFQCIDGIPVWRYKRIR